MAHGRLGCIGGWLILSIITAGAQAQTLDGAAMAMAPRSAVNVSQASDARAYRRDAAQHLYAVYADRIYLGKLPPLIHAVVVVETMLDTQGRVLDVNFLRVPSHAPEVVLAVRDLISRAAPLPAPARLGDVRYIETWLVDRSGRFQLDTLTEGQLDGESSPP
jgi:hypothetical protein